MRLASSFLEHPEMPRQGVDAQRVHGNVLGSRWVKVLDQVLQVDQPVIDGRGRQHE
jgi:hypothetical protein